MFGVVIVDDEEPVLDSYEFMLNAFQEEGGGPPFCLAGKARTGYQALQLIYETEPDLVFMDINIPGIDGLSVLEEVHKKFPRMVCVLSTAYERFDLARRAIPLGVSDYLVKPVSRRTFFTALENALALLRSRPEEDPAAAEPGVRFLQKEIWAAMSEESWERYRQTLSLSSGQGLVLMVECEKDTNRFCERACEKLSYRYRCLYDVMLNRGLFLISENVESAEFRRSWEECAAALSREFNGALWYWGAGGLYRGPELYRSCAEALAELERRRGETGIEERQRLRIIALREKLAAADREGSRALFTGIWEAAVSPSGGEFSTGAKTAMNGLFTLLVDDVTGAWKNSGSSLPFNPAEIMEIAGVDEWKRWAELHFEKLLVLASEHRSVPPALEKALSFVREHYAEGIQLGDAAEAALVSSAHLSRLFTEHLKTGFTDYLTALRIGAAEKLLKETPVSVKEAAFAVGYQDPNYFSKTFKRITGRLPREVSQ